MDGGLTPELVFSASESDPTGSFPAVSESQQMESDPSPPPQAPFHTPSPEQASSAPLAESVTAFEAVKPHNLPDAPYSPFPPSLSPAPDPEPQRSPRVSLIGMVTSLPNTPPGSNAVWRKNQGRHL